MKARRVCTAVFAAMCVASVFFAGTAVAQQDPVSSPFPETSEISACDTTTGEVTWSLTWTNVFDVAIDIDVDHFFITYDLDVSQQILDLTDQIPTSLAPGETATIGPVNFPGAGGYGFDTLVYFSTELSEEPVPQFPLGIGYMCPVQATPEPPSPAPVEPRFTG